jgi:hypothetical protein
VETLALKRRALQQRQLLQRYFAIYDAFQKYAEALGPFVKDGEVDKDLVVAEERFRLAFSEYESSFFEWHDGNQIINEGVAAFLGDPEPFRKDEGLFRMMLLLATTKFEDILRKAARDLTEIHEEIALVEGESKAEEITHVPSSALTKMKEVDAVAEIGSKWLGRIIRFAPWAYGILKNIHA